MHSGIALLTSLPGCFQLMLCASSVATDTTCPSPCCLQLSLSDENYPSKWVVREQLVTATCIARGLKKTQVRPAIPFLEKANAAFSSHSYFFPAGKQGSSPQNQTFPSSMLYVEVTFLLARV